MDESFPYIIINDGTVVGQISGQPLVIAANCMNVSIPTAEYYMKLRFSGVRTIFASLKWLWAVLHLDNTPKVTAEEITNVYRLMKQLGIIIHSAIGRRWFDTFNEIVPDFDRLTIREIMQTLQYEIPSAWLDRGFLRKYTDSDLPLFPKYKELFTIEEIVNAGGLTNTLDTNVVLYIDRRRCGPLFDIEITIDGVVVSSGILDITPHLWTLDVTGHKQFRRVNMGHWVKLRAPQTRIDIRFYDTKTPGTFHPPADPRVEKRKMELFHAMFIGRRYLTSIPAGKGWLPLYGDVVVMGRISEYFRLLQLCQRGDTSEETTLVMPNDDLTPEIWNVWAVLNGSVLITPNNLQQAWYYCNYFSIDISNPYTISIISKMIDVVLGIKISIPEPAPRRSLICAHRNKSGKDAGKLCSKKPTLFGTDDSIVYCSTHYRIDYERKILNEKNEVPVRRRIDSEKSNNLTLEMKIVPETKDLLIARQGVASSLLTIPRAKRKATGFFDAVDGYMGSPAERAIFHATGEIRLPLSYPYVDYSEISFEAAIERKALCGSGLIYVMIYGPIGDEKSGKYPQYSEVTRISKAGYQIISTNGFKLISRGGSDKWSYHAGDLNGRPILLIPSVVGAGSDIVDTLI